MIDDAPLKRLSRRQVPEKSAAHAALGARTTTAVTVASFICHLLPFARPVVARRRHFERGPSYIDRLKSRVGLAMLAACRRPKTPCHPPRCPTRACRKSTKRREMPPAREPTRRRIHPTP